MKGPNTLDSQTSSWAFERVGFVSSFFYLAFLKANDTLTFTMAWFCVAKLLPLMLVTLLIDTEKQPEGSGDWFYRTLKGIHSRSKSQ